MDSKMNNEPLDKTAKVETPKNNAEASSTTSTNNGKDVAKDTAGTAKGTAAGTAKGTAGTANSTPGTTKEVKKEVDLAPSQTANIIMSVIMAAIGLIFIFLCDKHQEVTKTVVLIGGLSFIVPGAYLLLSILVDRKKQAHGSLLSFMMGICGVLAIVLGIVMLVTPETFKDFLVYLFGGLLILASAWQFDVMMRKNRGVLYPAWLVVAPVLLVAAGVMLCTMDTFKGETNQKWMLLMSGIGFTLFGLIGLFISYFALRSNHQARKEAALTQESEEQAEN